MVNTVVEVGQVSAPAHTRNNFDLIRLGAALQVVIYHATLLLGGHAPTLVYLLLDSVPGVPVFFTVSGFLITGALLRDPSARDYAFNRAVRIYPALWGCFGVTLGLVLASRVIGIGYLLGPRGIGWIAGQLVAASGTPHPVRAFGAGTPNDSLWSIPVELQFYAIAGLVFLVAAQAALSTTQRRNLMGLAGCVSFACALIAARHFGGARIADAKLFNATALPYFWQFSLGSVARLSWPVIQPFLRRPLGWWIAAIGWYCLVTHHLTGSFQVDLQAPVQLGLLAGAVLATAHWRPGLAHRVLRGNDVSYGLYLYHFLVINSLVQWTHLRGWGGDLVVLLTASALATASWLLVERPAMRWKKRRQVTGTTAPVAVS